MSTTIAVTIVNWNGMDFLPDCLLSLENQARRPDEVVVVDNASTDGSVSYVRSKHPSVSVVECGRNLGFAAGANLGIRRSRGDLIATVNNDVVLDPSWLLHLEQAAGTESRFGMFASTMLFSARPELVSSAGIEFRWDGVAADRLVGKPFCEEAGRPPYEVFGPSAGAAVYRKDLLEDTGLFDEDYFAYLEDADLAWRARLRGWRCLYVPQAFSYHRYSASSGQTSPFKSRQLARNRIRTIVKNVPSSILLRHLPSIILYDLLAMAYGAASGDRWIVRGRLEAVSELPALLRKRRQVQATRKVSNMDLEGLLARPAGKLGDYKDRKWLNELLAGQS